MDTANLIDQEIPARYIEVACDLCGSPPGRPFLAKWEGFYTRCPECDFVYSNPRHPDPSAYNTWHNEALQGFYVGKQYSQRHQRKYTRILKSLEPYRRTGRILEIGCSTGGFCWRAKQLGWTPTGVEPVAKVAEVGRERGLNIECGTLEEAAFPDETFDVVFSNAVLEHVPSPGALLRETWRVLRPGGVVYADTVNIASYTARWLGARWKLIDPRAHLSLFTPGTLGHYCELVGFEVLKLMSHGVRFRPNDAPPLRGPARWWEELRKGPWELAARRTLQGESIAVVARKDCER